MTNDLLAVHVLYKKKRLCEDRFKKASDIKKQEDKEKADIKRREDKEKAKEAERAARRKKEETKRNTLMLGQKIEME